MALGGPSKVVRIYSTKDGKLLHEIRKHTDWVTSLEYSPDGVLLATGDRNGGLFVWEAFTGREYFTPPRPHGGDHGNQLATRRQRLRRRPARTARSGCGRWRTATRSSRGAPTAAASSRCVTAATAGSSRPAATSWSKLWDGAGNALRTFDAVPDVALRTAFTHDGGRVIAGDWTGQVMVWTCAPTARRSVS